MTNISPIGVSSWSTSNSKASGTCAPWTRRCGCVSSPKVLCRIRTPRPPRFGAAEKASRRGPCSIHSGRAAQQAEVGGREGIHFAQGAHSNILGRPFTHAGDVPQTYDRFLDGSKGAKEVGIGDRGFSHCADGGLPGDWDL